MIDGQPAPKDSLKDRLFLFGIRQLVLVIAIVAVGAYVTLSGLIYDSADSIVGGAIIILIGVGLLYGFRTTAIKKITKRYYAVETVVGKEGTAKSTFDSSSKGVVNVDNEYWSAITEERIHEGDTIVVVSVESDKVTLKVKKQGSS